MRLVEENPDARIAVLVGHGHLHRSFGIPARVARRRPDLSLLTVGFDKAGEWEPDYWFLEDPSSEAAPHKTGPQCSHLVHSWLFMSTP